MILRKLLLTNILLAGIAASIPVQAHEIASNTESQIAVVPAEEKKRAQELMANGPKKTSGIGGVTVVGTVSLDGEFESSDGLTMRVRELIINPGGLVAVHEHNNRPGVAYILKGEMTEHRSSVEKPIVKTAGTTAMERSGVVHWWENTGSEPAHALVVDIIPQK